MKTIQTLDEYYDIITSRPYSIIIFSSLKTCAPCRALKKWIDETHASVPGIYELDVMLPEFEPIVDHVDCMPTVVLFSYTQHSKKLEGFNKVDTQRLIDELKEHNSSPDNSKQAPSITLL